MKVLVVAPHPDDEVLGAGGTLARHALKADDICLVIVTDPYTPDWSNEYISKKKEQVQQSCKILGISKIFYLEFPTVKLDTIPQKEINKRLFDIVEEFKPDIAYIPHNGDINRDHRLVFEAALVALRPTSCSVKQILSYEVPSETEWGRQISPFIPTRYVNISSTIQLKIQAMEAYASEIRSFPHPRSVENIAALAKIRGAEVNIGSAEAFMVIREIH